MFIYNIPSDVKYVVVADLFAEDYTGGAELTLEAILSKCPDKYFKIKSGLLTVDLIRKNKDKYWILGNIAQLSKDCQIELATETQYSKIECDYFYCKYRSSHLHKLSTGQDCDCHLDKYGMFVMGLYKRAQHVFFMSQGQLNEYKNKFPKLNIWPEDKLLVLGSCFDDASLDFIANLRYNKDYDNGKYFIQGGSNTSWIKNTEGCVEYCQKNNIKHDVVGGLPYKDFVKKMSEYKGLVFMPKGFDTNPRITIEASLLGLDLHLNDNVQQKYDHWFNLEPEEMDKYLRKLPSSFWNSL